MIKFALWPDVAMKLLWFFKNGEHWDGIGGYEMFEWDVSMDDVLHWVIILMLAVLLWR